MQPVKRTVELGMSYSNSFRILIVEDCDLGAICKIINETASEKGDGYDIFVPYDADNDVEIRACQEEFRWGEWIEDMTKVSLLIPHLAITVFREGEDAPDYERCVFRNGTHAMSKGKVTYPSVRDDIARLGPGKSFHLLGSYFAANVKGQGTIIIQAISIERARMTFRAEYGARNIEDDGLVWIPRRETLAAYKLMGNAVEIFE